MVAPATRPMERPTRARPTKSQATLVARMKTTVLRAMSPMDTASTGRHPTWSEARPASSRAARIAAALVAKTSVKMPEEKCHCAW